MDRLVAQLRAAGCVFAEDEAQLLREASAGDEARLNELASRRCAGEPLHQVVGWAQFADIRVSLRPGVFVPRPRTEALVAHALRRCTQAAPIVVDLCCGSGALGIAFAAGCPAATLHATDIDEAALACARENVGARGDVHGGDLFDALPADLRGRIDVLLANVPYVPTTQLELMPVDARAHERRITLDGGDDGLDVLRRVAAGASGTGQLHGSRPRCAARHRRGAGRTYPRCQPCVRGRLQAVIRLRPRRVLHSAPAVSSDTSGAFPA